MLKKNLFYNFIYQILLIILPLFTAPYLSRILGPDGIGIYSYTYSIAYYFTIIVVLGLDNYGNRSIASVREDKGLLTEMFWSIFAMQVCMGIISVIIYFIYIKFIFESYSLVSWLWLPFVISAVFDINWFFFGLEQFKLTITRNVIIKLFAVGCIFIFVKSSEDTWIYVSIMSISFFFSQLVLWTFVKRYVGKPRYYYLMKMSAHIKSNLILFLPVIAVSIYRRMDKIMLGLMSSITQVGFYENSEKAISIPLGLITAIGTVMLPRMANLIAHGEYEKEQLYITNSMKLVMCASAGCCFGLMAISDDFSVIFFGSDFEACGALIAAMAVTVPFMAWANVIRKQYLVPHQIDKVFVISVFLGALVNLVLNLILIPAMDAMGAVIGTIAAEISVAVYQTYKIRKHLNIRSYKGFTVAYMLVGMVMYGSLVLVKTLLDVSVLSLVVQIVTGGFVFCCLSLVYIYIADKCILNLVMGTVLGTLKHCNRRILK